nr:MAG TPA: hypothetical protein [Caudoviricetes sp.]
MLPFCYHFIFHYFYIMKIINLTKQKNIKNKLL